MSSSSFIGLVNNAALLLALGLLYDMMGFRLRDEGSMGRRLTAGAVSGAIGIAIMLNPWDFGQGVVFDTRSVLLSISGFFFGPLPATLTVSMTGAFRLFLGGTGAWTGVAVIVTSAGIGLTWRHFRRDRPDYPSTGELYLLGIVVHVAMLAWMLTLPWGVAVGVLSRITLPVMLIYPLTTAVLGMLMVNQEKRRRSEKDLRERERFLRSVIQTTLDGFWVLDNHGCVTEVNEAYCAMSGYTRDEVIGMRVSDLDAHESTEQTRARIRRIVANRSEIFQAHHRRKDGSVFPVEISATFVNEHGGLFVCFCRDMTVHVKAMDAIERSHDLMRYIIEHDNRAVAVHDRDLKYVYVSQRYLDRHGLREGDVIGRHHYEVFPDLPQKWRDAHRKALAGEITSAERDAIPREDGTVDWARWECRPWYETDGTVGGIIFSTEIITDRVEAEERLRESERILNASQSLARVGGWEWDLASQTMKWTEEVYRIHDLDPREFRPGSADHIARSSACYAPEDRDLILAAFRLCAEKGEPYDLELPFTTGKGRRLWVRTTAEAVWEGGRIIRVIGNIMDITERKHSEKQRIQSLDLLSNLARLVPGVIYQFRLYPDGRSAFPYASPGMYDIYEVTPEQVREDATPVYGRLHPDDYDQVVDAIRESARTLNTFYCEFRVILPGQGLRWRWSQAHPERMADGSTLWHGIILDVTERVHADENLREKEEYQRAMIEASPLAIVSLDPEGFVRSWNKAAERMFGWSEAEVTGRFLPIVQEDQHEDYAALRRRVVNGEAVFQIELTRQRRDGSPIGVSLSTAPVRDKNGRVTAILAVLEDITDRKRAEKERDRLQAQFIQAQKMESVGRLAGGVAHDYNNMISVVIGYTELAMGRMDPGSLLHSYLAEVLAAAERSADITRKLLAFSRKQTIAPKLMDLNATVKDLLKMIRRLIGEDIELVWRPGHLPWPLYMDPSQLDQILMNLCINARDAITDVGKITIETDTRTLDEAFCLDHAGLVPGEFVVLSVSDNGCGMDRETQEHIFEPFFTTKDPGKGTGLGLATVYGIVRQNCGLIDVSSEPGQGTSFRIYLPRHESAVNLPRNDDDKGVDVGGNETILLVEDEQTILKMTTKMLERLGYAVLTAGTPGEALDLATGNAGRIHLLLTDVVMPDMNGRELSDRLLGLCPDLKVLFMSGYTADVIAHRGVLDEGVNFITKPFSNKDLALRVREALDSPGQDPKSP